GHLAAASALAYRWRPRTAGNQLIHPDDEAVTTHGGDGQNRPNRDGQDEEHPELALAHRPIFRTVKIRIAQAITSRHGKATLTPQYGFGRPSRHWEERRQAEQITSARKRLVFFALAQQDARVPARATAGPARCGRRPCGAPRKGLRRRA